MANHYTGFADVDDANMEQQQHQFRTKIGSIAIRLTAEIELFMQIIYDVRAGNRNAVT